MTVPGALCSREPCSVDVCCDRRVRTGKEPLDQEIIRIRYSTVRTAPRFRDLALLGSPMEALVVQYWSWRSLLAAWREDGVGFDCRVKTLVCVSKGTFQIEGTTL
jgi:hypothetical protein